MSNAALRLALADDTNPSVLSNRADAIDAALQRAWEAAAREHENINAASNTERRHGDPGADAMGAVIEYRDAIRALAYPGADVVLGEVETPLHG